MPGVVPNPALGPRGTGRVSVIADWLGGTAPAPANCGARAAASIRALADGDVRSNPPRDGALAAPNGSAAGPVRRRTPAGGAAPWATALRGEANAVARASPALSLGGLTTEAARMPISLGCGPTVGPAPTRPPTLGVAATRPAPTLGVAATRPPPPTVGAAATRPGPGE
jgi:hypothetical protein